MSKVLFLSFGIVFFLQSAPMQAGSFRKDSQNWDIRVYKTDKKYLADLVVYEVPSFREAEGNDALWKWSAAGYTSVAFTNSIQAADLVIYITHDKRESGWQRKHPLAGHLLK